MQETPAALQAFEDYWALGDDRSLEGLWRQYKARDESGAKPGPPTVRLNTLKEWSSEHNWQDRVKARIDEEAARVRKKMQEEADQTREMVTTVIVTGIRRLVKELAENPNKRLLENTADLERMVKLYCQLTGQPLAERTELSGPGGGAVEVHWIEKLREACGEEDEDGEG